MTMTGDESPRNLGALAPTVEDPKRVAILEAIRWIGPLAVSELKAELEDPELQLAIVHYRVAQLVTEGVLIDVGRRPAGGSLETLYFFSLR